MISPLSQGNSDVTHGLKEGPRSAIMSFWLFVRYVFTKLASIHWREALQPRVLFSWDDKTALRSAGTSWLDGLRGIACMQVVFFHFFGRYTKWQRTYGSSEEDHYIHQLPIFRSIWGAGSAAVCVFFVISGYAITVKCLTLLRRRDLEGFHKSLASSVIRRGFRLYLPIFLLAIPMVIVIRCVDMQHEGYIYGPEHQETLPLQVVHLLNQTDSLINPFMYSETNPTANRYAYVPTSWTIPMEYHGSIVCYLLLLVLSRVQVFKIREIIMGSMALYSLHRGCWWVSNFVVGMMIADYMLEQQSRKGSLERELSAGKQRWRTAGYYSMFLFAYYLAGLCPDYMPFDFDPKPKPGYEFLYKLYPPYSAFQFATPSRWWWFWSGNFTVLSIGQLPRLRAVCESHFCQWLGKLSFPLYLVHAAVIAALTVPIESMVKDFTDSTLILCAIEFSLIIPTSFILAGVVERYMDRPSIQFARFVERYITQDQPTEQEEGLLHANAVEMEERLDRAAPAPEHP